MARMIPDYIDQDDPRLDAERMVFDWLASSLVPGIGMHSLLQKNQRNKLIGEIDFLYISRRGILCIEVKGGRVKREAGRWYSEGKNGKVNEIKDPFRQVKDCRYAVGNYLESVYGKGTQETKCILGYAVIMPECIFTGDGNDLMTEVLFDCKSNLKDFPKYIEQTFYFWQKQEAEKHNAATCQLTEAQLEKYVDLFRGDFQVVPSLNLNMQYVGQKMLELTQEQFDVLDVTLSNKKVVVQGGAGTGKSILAIEKARKLMAGNKKVAYVCFNRNMAKYAQSAFRTIPEGSYVGTFHSLLMHLNEKITDYDIAVSDVSKIFLEAGGAERKFDCLVIDEAQDLMFVDAVKVFSNILQDGIGQGEWVMFLDPNQNIFNQTDAYEEAWNYLIREHSPAVIPLNTNCRNTEPIGKHTSIVTLVPAARHMKISGPNVVKKMYKSKIECQNILEKELKSLIAGGTAVHNVVLLSKYKLSNSTLAGRATLCELPIVEPADITGLQKRAWNFFTIQSFKGLEADVVFLLDVDGFSGMQNRMKNYVGMSRARFMLYYFFSKEKRDEFYDLIDQIPDDA